MAASVNALRPRDTIERWTILSFSFPVSFFFFFGNNGNVFLSFSSCVFDVSKEGSSPVRRESATSYAVRVTRNG